MEVINALLLEIGISACLIICFDKWRWLEKYEELRSINKYLAKLPQRCEFCLSFWLSILVLIILFIFGYQISLIILLTPFASAGFTQKLLR